MMLDEPENRSEDTELDEASNRVMESFERQTLQDLEGRFNQLIYLASLRDYNTGRYHHYGLETRYSTGVVDEALRRCHARAFEELMLLPLEDQTRDLVGFFESVKEDRGRLIQTWRRLRSYQVLPPEDCPPLARQLFEKNLEIILQVLRQTDLWALLHEPHGDTDDLP